MIYRLSVALMALSLLLMSAQTSQVNSYINGNVLTADQLNSEFSNIYNTINNLDNANLSDTAGILPVKISSTIDGDGISRSVTGVLSAAVDGVTVKIQSDQLVIDDMPGTALADGAVESLQIANGTVAKIDEAVKTTAATATLGNVALSTGTGAVLLTFTTGMVADLTNNLVNLTTNGSPVRIQIVPATDASQSYIECEDNATDPCILELRRDGFLVTEIPFFTEAGIIRMAPGEFSWIDTPAAGTYEYKIRYQVPSATALRVLNVRLMAYEL